MSGAPVARQGKARQGKAVKGNKIIQGSWTVFIGSQGGVVCSECSEKSDTKGQPVSCSLARSMWPCYAPCQHSRTMSGTRWRQTASAMLGNTFEAKALPTTSEATRSFRS